MLKGLGRSPENFVMNAAIPEVSRCCGGTCYRNKESHAHQERLAHSSIQTIRRRARHEKPDLHSKCSRSRQCPASLCRNFELVSSEFPDRKPDHSTRVCLYIQCHSARSIFFEALGSRAGQLLGYRLLPLDEYPHRSLFAATRGRPAMGTVLLPCGDLLFKQQECISRCDGENTRPMLIT